MRDRRPARQKLEASLQVGVFRSASKFERSYIVWEESTNNWLVLYSRVAARRGAARWQKLSTISKK